MRTVTLVAHNRPVYTGNAISALLNALVKPAEPVFDKLLFSIDSGCPEVAALCDRAAEILSSNGIIDCEVYVNAERFGVAGNTLIALKRAFEEHGSEYNLSVEDDAVLRPDAVAVADWFWQAHGGPLSDYTLFSLSNHRDFGRGKNPGNIPDDPAMMAESAIITSPFAWCLSKWQWSFVERTWASKVLPPNGWDFSLSYSMRKERRRALHPILSRCMNIGREGGEHETPESFDKTQSGLTYSDGSYEGPYKVVVRIPDSELSKADPWMLSELRLSYRR